MGATATATTAATTSVADGAAMATATGVQLTATLSAGRSGRWFTHGWHPADRIEWWVLPTTVSAGAAPQLRWDVASARDADGSRGYWLTVTNLTTTTVTFEGRYTVLAT